MRKLHRSDLRRRRIESAFIIGVFLYGVLWGIFRIFMNYPEFGWSEIIVITVGVLGILREVIYGRGKNSCSIMNREK